MTDAISTDKKLGILATDQLCHMLSGDSNILLAWLKIVVGDKKAPIPAMLSKFFEYGLSTAGISASIITITSGEVEPSLLIQASGAASDSSAHPLAPWLQELCRETGRREQPVSASEVESLVRRIKPPIEREGREISPGITTREALRKKLGPTLIESIIGLFTHDDRAFRLWVETTMPPAPFVTAPRALLRSFLQELFQSTGMKATLTIIQDEAGSSSPFVVDVSATEASPQNLNFNLNDWLQRYCTLASNKPSLAREEILNLIDESKAPQRAVPDEMPKSENRAARNQTTRSNRGAMMTLKKIIKELEHPYKEFPPLSEMKIATISWIDGAANESVRPGMYMVVPPYFPDQCKVIPATGVTKSA